MHTAEIAAQVTAAAQELLQIGAVKPCSLRSVLSTLES